MLRNFIPGSPDNASIALPPNATGWWHEKEKIYSQFKQATLQDHDTDTVHCLRRRSGGWENCSFSECSLERLRMPWRAKFCLKGCVYLENTLIFWQNFVLPVVSETVTTCQSECPACSDSGDIFLVLRIACSIWCMIFALFEAKRG